VDFIPRATLVDRFQRIVAGSGIDSVDVGFRNCEIPNYRTIGNDRVCIARFRGVAESIDFSRSRGCHKHSGEQHDDESDCHEEFSYFFHRLLFFSLRIFLIDFDYFIPPPRKEFCAEVP